MKPNVLLIVLDTARADAFEPYGAPSGSTPVVRDLAASGVAFPLVIAPSSWTMPSHASMFTGLLPRAVGLRAETFGGGRMKTLLPSVFAAHGNRVLAEVLRRDGYSTSALSANVWISPASGLTYGFQRFADAQVPRPPANGSGADRLAWWRASLDSGASAARRLMLEELDRGGTGPFFWFINLMECHSPYYPPKPYNDLGPVRRWRAIDDVDRYQSWAGFFLTTLGTLPMEDGAVERMRHLYRRSVLMMDDWIGWLLGELDRRGVLQDTLTIVTSDHGENLGESHRLGHVLSLDQRLLHVPLVATGPGTPPTPSLFSLVDLPRLIGDSIGLASHPWERGDHELAFAQDERIDLPGPEQMARAAAAGFDEEAVRRYMLARAAVTDGRFKLVREDRDDVLYDLERDPLETRDVSDGEPEALTRLRAALDRVHAATGASIPDPSTASNVEEREIEAHLEQLGYL